MTDDVKQEREGVVAPLPTTFVIQANFAGPPLLTIHPNGIVEGEMENAGEAARLFVEHVRRLIAEPQTDALKIAREAFERIKNRKWNTLIQGCDAAVEAFHIARDTLAALEQSK